MAVLKTALIAVSPPGSRESALLACLVAATGLVLGWRQWRERAKRPEELPVADRKYLKNRDLRRFAGATLLAVMAVAIVLGTRIEVARGDRVAGRAFVAWWIGVGFGLVVLWILALWDIGSNLHHARVERRRMVEERSNALRQLGLGRGGRSAYRGVFDGLADRKQHDEPML